MTEKKTVFRNMAITLGMICITLIAGLAIVIFEYSSVIRNKDSQIEALTDEKNQLQTWLETNTTLLNQTQAWLQGNITQYNSEIWGLNAQLATLEEQIDMLTKRVSFYKWADGSNTTSVSLAYALQPNTTLTDANATYGIKNGATSDRSISIWAESFNATPWISNFEIEILDTNGLLKITVPIVTSVNNYSIVYVGKVGWNQAPNTIYAMRILIKSKPIVDPGTYVQVQLNLESRIFPHP